MNKIEKKINLIFEMRNKSLKLMFPPNRIPKQRHYALYIRKEITK